MKLFFLSVFFLSALYVHAQFAMIDDPDGYVNLRFKPNSSSDVVMKVTTSDLFFCFEAEGDWYPADVYITEGDVTSGYIHKSRVKFIHEYDSLSVNQIGKDKISFKNKTIQVEVKTKPFDPKANTIEYDHNHQYVETVNHKRAWGVDGNVPRMGYEYIWVMIGEKKIILPAEAYSQLFEPTLEYMNVNYDIQRDTLYIHGLNSDGAGAYTFVIIIKNKKFERTVAMIPF